MTNQSPHAPTQNLDLPSGTIDNRSETGRKEVGGLALFGGVLMVSRTGFAISMRRKDGAIALRQIPFPKRKKKRLADRIPLVRGLALHEEMIDIAWEGFCFSREVLDDPAEKSPPMDQRHAPLGLLMAASVGMLSFLFIILPELLLWTFGVRWAETNALFFHFCATIIRYGALLLYVAALGLDGSIRDVFRYHGAEHQAVLAFEQGRDVTVARARQQGLFHERCGSNLLALVTLTTGLIFLLGDIALSLLMTDLYGAPTWQSASLRMLVYTLSLPVIYGLSYETLRLVALAPKHMVSQWILAPGRLMQRWTTRHPNDQQVEVAIVALLGALAISSNDSGAQTHVVRGLVDDESAPGYLEPKLAIAKASPQVRDEA